MEKLIGLLNEFCREKRGDYVVVKYREKEHSFDTFVEGKVDYMTDLYVVSKRCGFIKWLYDNEKIDIFCEKHYQIVNGSIPKGNIADIEDYERDIMQLSISDNPIQDLIGLLK